MYNFFKYRHNVLNYIDFTVGNKYQRVAENSFHFIGIGYHVRAYVAAVKLHAFNSFKAGFHSFGFFNGNNAVVANFFHSVSNQIADFFISCRNGSYLSFCFFGFYFFADCFQFVNQNVYCILNAFFKNHRVCTGCYVAQAFMYHSLCQNGCGGGAVACYVVGFGCNFFNKLCAHVFKRVFQFNIAGNGYTVVGNGRCAEFFLQHNVAAFRPKGYFYGISQCVNAAFKAATSFFVEFYFFSHLKCTPLNSLSITVRQVRRVRSKSNILCRPV